jgi:hypothetical protein
VLKGHKEVEDLKVLRALREVLVYKVPLEQPVQQVLPVQQGLKGISPMDRQGSMVHKEPLVQQGLKVPKVLKELRVLQDHQRLLVLHLVVLGVLGVRKKRVLQETVALFSRIVAVGLPDVIFTTQVNVRNVIVKMGSGIGIVMVLLGR